jgi:hypothetical protein
MSVILEQLTQILETTGISSQEEHILTAVKILTTSPKEKEESTFEDSYTSDGEQLFEHEIKEDNKEISSDLNQDITQAYESPIEVCFQESIRLDQSFCFYLVNS